MRIAKPVLIVLSIILILLTVTTVTALGIRRTESDSPRWEALIPTPRESAGVSYPNPGPPADAERICLHYVNGLQLVIDCPPTDQP
jgi:hypothetical protein